MPYSVKMSTTTIHVGFKQLFKYKHDFSKQYEFFVNFEGVMVVGRVRRDEATDRVLLGLDL